MSINPGVSLPFRLFSRFRKKMPMALSAPQRFGLADDWGASVFRSIRCELPHMESIMRLM